MPGHTVTITPADNHVEVVVNGATVAESDRPLRLEETGLPARYYLPREDVRMDLFRGTDLHTTCPFKGEASYWTLELGGQIFDGIAWSYEQPIASAAPIAGHLCFWPERVEMKVRETGRDA